MTRANNPAREVCLAAQEPPEGKAAGPYQISAEVYGNLPQLQETLAKLYSKMIEENVIPEGDSRYSYLPFDKPGKGPSRCESRRPISALNTSMRLLQAVPVKQLKTMLEPAMAGSRYTY